MAVRLVEHSYGKSRVRLTKVTRHPDRCDLTELCVDLRLQGDFAESYTAGDNRSVIATDSIKNTIYVLAREHPIPAIESFALLLARHFVSQYPQVTAADVDVVDQTWDRIAPDRAGLAHAFAGRAAGHRTCSVRAARTTETSPALQVDAGLKGLPILKTTHSEFTGFVRDRYATLADTDDRILATLLSARWIYDSADLDWNACHALISRALLVAFAEHHSLAVQQTLYAMAEAALAACEQIERITIEMPNQHRLLVDLTPFGLDNPNEIFVPTDEPFGLITATLTRE